jgi:hypothetical protein
MFSHAWQAAEGHRLQIRGHRDRPMRVAQVTDRLREAGTATVRGVQPAGPMDLASVTAFKSGWHRVWLGQPR